MQFWLGIGLRERFDDGEGISVRLDSRSFSSFDEAIEALAAAEPPVVLGQVVEANAYVVRGETIDAAHTLLRSVFEDHETSPHVKLVERNIRTHHVKGDPPDVRALSHVHGELCITHQIAALVLQHAPPGNGRDRLEQHRNAIEDLGFALRVLQAELQGHPPPQPAPRGPARLGYIPGSIGSAGPPGLAGALSSLEAELSIAGHQTTLAQHSLSGDTRLNALAAELQAFAATVRDYA